MTHRRIGHRRSRFVPFIVLLTTLTCPLVTAADDPGESSTLPRTKGWIEASSAHFDVYSDAGEGRARKIAVQLERFRNALSRTSKGLALDDPLPTTFFAFRNDSEYTPYKLDESGR